MRNAILHALSAFAESRPGLEPGNYASYRDYRAESARVTRDLHQFRALLRYAMMRESVTEEMLRDGFRAFSGRLTPVFRADGFVALSYTTGQYYPTEYRRAACAVLASSLWARFRADLPENVENVGEAIRKAARRELGARLAREWFA